MRHASAPSPRRTPPMALLAVVAPLAVATGCAAGTEGLAGPEGVSIVTGTTGITPGATSGAALVGEWTRVEGAGASLTETRFSFGADGRGSRTTVVRTQLGVEVAADRQPFAWNAGGGVLVLQLAGPVGTTTRRASFRVDVALEATTLTLDGVSYRRTGG